MKVKYLKLKQCLLASLGGLLGITLAGCDDFYGVDEYGCPTGDYQDTMVVEAAPSGYDENWNDQTVEIANDVVSRDI